MNTKVESVAAINEKVGADDDVSTARRVADAAHGVIDDTAAKAEAVEQQLREQAVKAGEKVGASQEAASEQLEQSIAKVETFVKGRPIAAAGIAFAAGVFATALLRR